MALTLFFLYSKPIASTGSYAGLYYHMKHLYLRLLLSLIAVGTIAQAPAQITLHEATNVTQTKATLSAEFPDLSVEHGFQYKYGTLPEIDDFSRTALAPQSDPISLTPNNWSARTIKGYVETYSGEGGTITAKVTLFQPATISFDWSIDAQEGCAFLRFSKDTGLGSSSTGGSSSISYYEIDRISGDTPFTTYSYNLDAGTHYLKWEYSQISPSSIGLDIARIKNINIQNSLPGEWKNIVTIDNEFNFSELIPNSNVLFRAYDKSDNNNYSEIKYFNTLPVDVESYNVSSITQTTATISRRVGICESKLNKGINYKPVDELSAILISEETDCSGITVSCSPKWRVAGDKLEYNVTTESGYAYGQLTLVFEIGGEKYSTSKVEFDVTNTGSYSSGCYFGLFVDGNKKVKKTFHKGSEHYVLELTSGKHTLQWKTQRWNNSAPGGTVSLSNLIIENIVSGTEYNTELTSTDDVVLSNLKPNHIYIAQSFATPEGANNEPQAWQGECSEWFRIKTLPVVVTSNCNDVTQSSFNITGLVDRGDATTQSIGIQYKILSGKEWIDVPIDNSLSEFSVKATRLKPANTYTYRCYAIPTDCDTVYSNIHEIITKAVLAHKPEILHLAQHEATLQGKVIFGDANIYQRGMQFRKKGITEWNEVEDGGNDSIYTLVRKNLEMGVAYEARTYVQPAGCDVIYSDILEFKTLYSYFTACNANNTTQTTATFEATISDVDEDTTVDEYGFEYYIYCDGFLENENNFVPSEIYTIPVTPDGKTIKTTITGLAPRLFLKWRAYAIVNGEKSYYAGSANSEWAYAATKPATIKATATKITPTSISLELDATQDGDAVISQIEYALANSPMDAAEYSICGNNITLTGLLPNSKYNFMFRGLVNDRYCPLFDSVYQDGSWFTFTTPAADVDVKIINVTQTKAEMNIIIDAGEEAEVTDLRYRLSNYGNWTECSEKLSLSGLTPGQKYNVYIGAKINGIEYSWSGFAFTTGKVSATVYTSDIQQTSARIRWSTFQGDATLISSGVEIGSDKYEFTDDTREITLTELSPNTSYSVRSYVQTEEGGKVYSQFRTIKTSEIICTTTSATSISNRSATLNGTIDCDTRSSAEFGVQWKKMIGWNSDPAFTKGHKLDDGSISVALVNGMLDPDTDYQYRTAVRYKDKIYYGDWATFRTEAEYVYYPASVYTIFRTDRENNSLVLCGYYIAGSEAIVSQGYEYWKKNPNAIHPLAAQSPAIVTTDESMQHVFAPGELPAGDYNVRAFVKTESGETIYGPTLGFTASNAGYSEVEEIPYDMPSVKVEHSIVKIYNAAGLECYVARINGIVVSSHTIPGDYDEIALSPGYYIIKLSNGLVEKIRL